MNLKDEFERISDKATKLKVMKLDIAKGTYDILKPHIDRIMELRSLDVEIHQASQGDCVLNFLEYDIDGEPLRIIPHPSTSRGDIKETDVVKIRADIPISLRIAEKTEELKWLADHVYEVRDKLKETINIYEKAIRNRLNDLDKKISQEEEYLSPEIVLERLSGNK